VERINFLQISYYTPQQIPPAGSAIDPQPDGREIPKLFQPLKLRGLTLQNRIFVSPMCQYSARDGKLTAWHLTHLGGIIQRGPGLTIVEATAVTPEGRISPEDSGLWEDAQIEPLKKLTEFAHSQGQCIGIQLGHAGRKSSTVAPWIDRKAKAGLDIGGWPDNVLSVSNVPYNEHTHVPRTVTAEDIASFKLSFVAAAKRAVIAGFDVCSTSLLVSPMGNPTLTLC
jgi:2,4-dienoyl-CoA reductase-like NADH-dependent reductase (Old Yellow Enzyme family)